MSNEADDHCAYMVDLGAMPSVLFNVGAQATERDLIWCCRYLSEQGDAPLRGACWREMAARLHVAVDRTAALAAEMRRPSRADEIRKARMQELQGGHKKALGACLDPSFWRGLSHTDAALLYPMIEILEFVESYMVPFESGDPHLTLGLRPLRPRLRKAVRELDARVPRETLAMVDGEETLLHRAEHPEERAEELAAGARGLYLPIADADELQRFADTLAHEAERLLLLQDSLAPYFPAKRAANRPHEAAARFLLDASLDGQPLDDDQIRGIFQKAGLPAPSKKTLRDLRRKPRSATGKTRQSAS